MQRRRFESRGVTVLVLLLEVWSALGRGKVAFALCL